MALVLRPESIIDRWEAVVENASERADQFLDSVESALEAAEIPGGCTWELREVRNAGHRPALVVRVQRLPDIRVYVSAKEYGVHLQVSRIISIEPGWLKRMWAERTCGDPLALSIPGDVPRRQDLSAFVAVVQHCVKSAAESLVGPRSRRESARIRRHTA